MSGAERGDDPDDPSVDSLRPPVPGGVERVQLREHRKSSRPPHPSPHRTRPPSDPGRVEARAGEGAGAPSGEPSRRRPLNPRTGTTSPGMPATPAQGVPRRKPTLPGMPAVSEVPPPVLPVDATSATAASDRRETVSPSDRPPRRRRRSAPRVESGRPPERPAWRPAAPLSERPGQRSSRPRPASMRPDPRTEGRSAAPAERVRTKLNALASSVPDPLPPDRTQQIEAVVRELARSGPDIDEPLRNRLLGFGTDSLTALAAAFPGAMWVDLTRPHRPLSSAQHLSAIARAIVAFGPAAAPHVAGLLRSPRSQIRLAACLVACDLRVGELVQPIATRLQDEVPAVRNAAMCALRVSAHLPQAQELRTELLTTLHDENKPDDWRRRAAYTLGQMREETAVRPLIEQLSGSADVVAAARDALLLITGHDLGRFRYRWRNWYSANGGKGRVYWLIDALDNAEVGMRARAVEELVLLTGLGYEQRSAVRDREDCRALAALYRGWAHEHT